MRFRSLKGLTTLPVERIRRRFRNEEVRSVLPAKTEGGGTDSLLVATTSALAIVTAEPEPKGDGWMTRWAPWDAVSLSDDADTSGAPDETGFHLTVRVDALRFFSYFPGEKGQRAMRDFVVASRERRESLEALL